jgi:hypothetical protein
LKAINNKFWNIETAIRTASGYLEKTCSLPLAVRIQDSFRSAEMGLPKPKEYWITASRLKSIAVNTQGEDRTKQVYRNLQSEIHFDSIGVKVNLADIYKRVRGSENILEMEREM